MPERTPFLLRLDPEVMAALRKWAADDLRSLNGQIEFLLRRALRDAGRIGGPEASGQETIVGSRGEPVEPIDDAAHGPDRG